MSAHRTVHEGRQLVELFYSSGLTEARFSLDQKMPVHTLRYWKRRVRELGTGQSMKVESQRFVEIAVPQQTGDRAVTIRAGQVEVSFSQVPPSTWLSDFVASLAQQ